MAPEIERRTMPLAELTPFPRNPRRISRAALEGLRRSIERFGLVQEIVVNRRTGHIVGGHQRVEALRDAGHTEAPVALVDLDEHEEMALNVALNNPGITGEFTDAVTGILSELETNLPDAFDELLLFKAVTALARAERDGEEQDEPAGEHDLSPAPYESYDYVMLIFRNAMDWTSAQEHFALKAVQDSYVGDRKRPAIGVGRVVDGATYLNRILAPCPHCGRRP